MVLSVDGRTTFFKRLHQLKQLTGISATPSGITIDSIHVSSKLLSDNFFKEAGILICCNANPKKDNAPISVMSSGRMTRRIGIYFLFSYISQSKKASSGILCPLTCAYCRFTTLTRPSFAQRTMVLKSRLSIGPCTTRESIPFHLSPKASSNCPYSLTLAS